MQLLVTMGTYHPTDRRYQGSWHYWGAVLQILDWESGRVVREVRHEPDPSHLGGEGRLLFMGADLTADELWVTTKTEVLGYDRATLRLETLFSRPEFCDLHSVVRVENELWIANTGRESVQVCDRSGTLLREYELASVPLAERWDATRDYRFQRDAKPYEVHANQVFRRGAELWVTSLGRQCALRVDQPGACVAIAVGQPHDGRLAAGKHWFTTTNGHLVAVDPRTLAVEETIDLAALHAAEASAADRAARSGDRESIGWCRGVEVVGRRAFVGFTRIRATRHAKHRFWRRSASEAAAAPPSRIVEIDLDRRRIVRSVPIVHPGAAVYSVLAWTP